MAKGVINLQKESGGVTKITSIDGTGITELVLSESGTVATQAYVDSKMVLGTAISIAGSTSVDFTGIPISAKRVTVMLDEVSTNGSSSIQIQIGNTSIETSGYLCTGFTTSGSNIGITPFTSGFVIGNSSQAPTMKISGFVTIDLFGENVYVANGMVGTNTTVSHNTAGSKNLGSALNMLRVTTVNGTDTFDTGSINIMYEG